MKNRTGRRWNVACALSLAVVFIGLIGPRAQEGSAADEKMAAIKQSLTKSMTALRSYEWIETTTVKVDGDQKSQKENRCYYGADGKEQKVPIDTGSEETSKKPRGIRGRVVKKKTGEMDDYVQQAAALIKQYIPPDPKRLQAIKDSGAQKLEVLDGATRLRAEFPAYLKQGDMLSVDVDPNANRILGIAVSSYLEDNPKDAVTLNVSFDTLQDGTSYPAKVDVGCPSKKLEILVENSGYQKSGS
jgi:hypothetical protein